MAGAGQAERIGHDAAECHRRARVGRPDRDRGQLHARLQPRRVDGLRRAHRSLEYVDEPVGGFWRRQHVRVAASERHRRDGHGRGDAVQRRPGCRWRHRRGVSGQRNAARRVEPRRLGRERRRLGAVRRRHRGGSRWLHRRRPGAGRRRARAAARGRAARRCHPAGRLSPADAPHRALERRDVGAIGRGRRPAQHVRRTRRCDFGQRGVHRGHVLPRRQPQQRKRQRARTGPLGRRAVVHVRRLLQRALGRRRTERTGGRRRARRRGRAVGRQLGREPGRGVGDG